MCAGGTFIDDGEGAEWGDTLRWHPFPFIADERDGTTFRNIAFRSNAPVNDAPAVTDQRPLDAAQQCPERGCDHAAGTVCAYALCPGKRAAVSPFHDNPDSPEVQQDHA